MGFLLEGTRLPRNLIMGVRARRRRVGRMVVVVEGRGGRGGEELGEELEVQSAGGEISGAVAKKTGLG